MLILRRVKLVNWHFFDNALVELGETTLLAGDNGSGKSTIIDAIQYALVSDIRKIQFNAAATQNRTSRNLESYCRCKIGATDLDFYKGDIISHIILEFQNSENRFLAGIMVEAYTNSDLRESLWILEQGKLEDIEIYQGEVMLQPRTFREQVKNLGANLCSTKREYSSRLTNLLKVHRRNIDFNPYFEALVRSVSFTPFTSIDRFVCNYILDERQVDISAMRENLFNYKEAEKEALAIAEKMEHLEVVMNLQKEVDDTTRAILNQEYLKHRLNLEITVQKRSENTRAGAEQQRLLANLQEKIAYTGEQWQKTETLLQELTLALASNDAHILYEQLVRRKGELAHSLQAEQERIARFNLYKQQCEALLGRAFAPALPDEIEIIDQAKSANLGLRLELEQKKKEAWQLFSDLKKEEQELQKGMLRYPESTLELRRALPENNIEAWVFADRIEVTDPAWQNAVEGWLNTQRFNILVQEKDFQKAIELYNRLPRKTAGVGIPNLAQMHSAEIMAGSLAEVVEADSPLARRYVAFLMGDVMMTTIEHLKEHARAITRECMKYNSHTATRIKEEVYAQWYIGKAARERRLAQVREELQAREKELEALARSLKASAEQEEILKRVYTTLHQLQNLEDAFVKAERCAGELALTDEQLRAIDTSAFEELKGRIAAVRLQLEALHRETAQLNRESGVMEEALKNLHVAAEQLTGEQEGYAEELQQFVKLHAQLLAGFEAYYDERVKRDRSPGGMKQLLSNYNQALKGLESKREDRRAKLRTQKHAYNLKYHTYMQEDGDDSAQFNAMLEKYRDTELPLYREKIEHARKEAELQFREHFVSRLNEYLTNARESFAELNHTLKDISFGQDQYRFLIEEQQEKKRLLEAIREAAQVRDYNGTLFEQLTSEEQKRSIEGLFDRILQNDLQSEEVRDICDYRKYFQYDIRIKHTKTVDKNTGKPLESSLSKVLREKSGGETQTPYYVAIAASFYRFYKDEKDAIRLVLFDEAFNKMDDDRIGNMVNFFKKLGMQVVTAVPTEKIETIAPYMERINLVIRRDYHAFVRDYALLKEETAGSGD